MIASSHTHRFATTRDAGVSMLKPGTAEEVSELLATETRPVTVVGSGILEMYLPVPKRDRLLLSTCGLNVIGALDDTTGMITVGSGVLADVLSEALVERGRECPLDPWWPGATVGGIVAAGLGGYRQLGRGGLRSLVAGVEVVTGSGRIINRAADSAAALVDMVVGSWGRRAVITSVTLHTQPRTSAQRWYRRTRPSAMRPSARICTTSADIVLLEGLESDLDRWASLVGAHRAAPEQVRDAMLALTAPLFAVASARLSVRSSDASAIVQELARSVSWAMEPEVGVLHLFTDDEPEALDWACLQATSAGGHALRYGSRPSSARPAGPAAQLLLPLSSDRLDWEGTLHGSGAGEPRVAIHERRRLTEDWPLHNRRNECAFTEPTTTRAGNCAARTEPPSFDTAIFDGRPRGPVESPNRW